ncbi:MAG: hypothetical protein ACFE9L_08660 [Candidatus Hodarchaeota archaeon]
MSIDNWIRPDLIRIKTDKDHSCFFCGEQSWKLILSENDKELALCYAHFEKLARTLHNFK